MVQHETVAAKPSPAEVATVAPAAGPVVGWIHTDSTITKRLAIRTGERTWRVIDDDQLLRALADAGKPAGLVEVEGRAYLLPE